MSAALQGNGSRPIDRLFATLREPAKRVGRGWKALCPAHNDSNPSLDITEKGDGDFVFVCRAGCSQEAVRAALGLSWAELLGPDRRLYYYGAGQRHHHRAKWQVSDGNGGWRDSKGDINDETRVLYNFEAIEAARPDTPIVIVEGERDVETMRRHGYMATTSGGADSWLPRFAATFTSRDVVMLPDQDVAGKKYLAAVSRDVVPIARSFRVVNVPHGKDVTEFFDNGGSEEQLDQIVAEAEPLTAETAALAVTARHSSLVPQYVASMPKPPPRSWVIKGLIPDASDEGHVTFLFGPGGVLKSWISLFMALCICLAKSFAGAFVRPGPVLWLDWEMGTHEFCRRVRSLCLGLGLEEHEIPTNLAYLSLTKSILNETLQEDLRLLIKSLRPRVVFIDSYTAMAASPGGELMSNDDIAIVIGIIKTFGCPVLVIDHTTKVAMAEKQLDATPIGGVTKWNLSRSQIVVGSSGSSIILRQRKHSFGPLCEPLAFQFTFPSEDDPGEEVVRVKVVPIDIPELVDLEAQLNADVRIMAALRREGPSTTTELEEDLETVKPKTVRNTLSILHRKGKVIRGADGRWAVSGPESLRSSSKGSGSGLARDPETNPEQSRLRDSTKIPPGNGRDHQSRRGEA